MAFRYGGKSKKYNVMDIQIGLYSGIMIGVRTFPYTEVYPYTETHVYIPFLYIAFINLPNLEE